MIGLTKEKALELLQGKITACRALGEAQAMFHWDATTSGVPEKSLGERAKASGWLSGESFRIIVADDTAEAVKTLEGTMDELDAYEQAMVKELSLQLKKIRAVPPDEMQEYMTLVAESETVWEKARAENDFNMIAPYYEKIFAFQRKLCDWYGYEEHPYDALLDDYEKGATVKMLDGFFAELRAKIVPILDTVTKSGKTPRKLNGEYPAGLQRELAEWLCGLVGYDVTRGKIGEAEHPYTITMSRNDVRITTKYHEDNLLSALYSTVHEAGHGLYEQNMEAKLDDYALGDGASMGMHESQSRLYENVIGRSRAFAELLLPKLHERFPSLSDWTVDDLYFAMNEAKPSLIRIEADELTYCLHIMVRYELEKALINGEINVSELPGLWNAKYEELLGVCSPDDAHGVLQDVHWGAGLVGYFASYAVGTAYAAQLMNAIRRDVNVDAAIRSGDLTPLTSWLAERVHVHGKLLQPDEILRRATGEPFNPKYYADYLAEKFTELYK